MNLTTGNGAVVLEPIPNQLLVKLVVRGSGTMTPPPPATPPKES